jgi:hypothetical protein
MFFLRPRTRSVFGKLDMCGVGVWCVWSIFIFIFDFGICFRRRRRYPLRRPKSSSPDTSGNFVLIL